MLHFLAFIKSCPMSYSAKFRPVIMPRNFFGLSTELLCRRRVFMNFKCCWDENFMKHFKISTIKKSRGVLARPILANRWQKLNWKSKK